MEKKLYAVMFACALAGGLLGALLALSVQAYVPKSNSQLIQEFYSTEHAVSVSPADYVRELKKGNVPGLLVDLRSAQEYNASHMVTAINIPAGSMTPDQILAAFSALPKNKPVITYCYTEYCILSRNVGNYLAQHGIYVMHFTAGWYEVSRDYSNFTVLGPQPGSFLTDLVHSEGSCPEPGISSFGC